MVGTSSITASSVASTALVFSPAFGGSAGQGRFSEAAGRSVAIDKFGRDYSLNMGALTGSIRGQGVSIASLAQPHNNGFNEISRSEERRVGKSVSVRVDLGGGRIIKKKMSTSTRRNR